MLPSRYRFPLRKHPDFFAQARRVSTQHLLAYIQPAESFAAAVVVPQKALNTTAPAVTRHQLKRWTTEALMKFGLTKAYSVVIVFKPRAESLSAADVKAEVEEIAGKL